MHGRCLLLWWRREVFIDHTSKCKEENYCKSQYNSCLWILLLYISVAWYILCACAMLMVEKGSKLICFQSDPQNWFISTTAKQHWWALLHSSFRHGKIAAANAAANVNINAFTPFLDDTYGFRMLGWLKSTCVIKARWQNIQKGVYLVTVTSKLKILEVIV